jgi:peptidoglycan/LPS O-acetylase OafA/YrhL
MISSLTGLRFFLAAMVVVYHYTHMPPAAGPQWLRYIAGNGFAGVSGFFVLSGFVLARSYIAPDGEMRGTLRGFWAARFARIYPVYFLSILLVVQTYWRLPDSIGEKALASLATLTGTQAWIPTTALAVSSAAWSLSVEGFLYVLFPLLLPLVHGPARRLWVIGIVCALVSLLPPALLCFVPAPSENVISFVRYNPLFHLPAFLAGMVTERLSRRIVTSAWIVWPAIGLIVWVFLSGDRIRYEFLNNGLLIVPFSAMILGLSCEKGVLSRLLSNRLLVRGGEASYSLYLLHLPLRPWVLAISDRLQLAPCSWAFLSLGCGLCVAASLVTFHFVEEPYRRSIRAALSNPRTSAPFRAAGFPIRR